MGWFIKFFEWLWLRGIKNWWSKLRWNKESKEKSYAVPVPKNNDEFMQYIRKLNKGYEWEMDGFDDLFDTYRPAPYAYNRMVDYITGKQTEINKFDCDDVHGAILNYLNNLGQNTALITLATIPITESHTMTAFKKTDANGEPNYYVINYTQLLGPYKNLQEFVDNYGTPVRYWCLQKYDYIKGKYYNIDKETFE